MKPALAQSGRPLRDPPIRRAGGLAALLVGAALALPCPPALALGGDPAWIARLTPQQRQQVEGIWSVLHSEKSDLAQRVKAASTMLATGASVVLDQFRTELATSPDPLVQRAITQALGGMAKPPGSFVPLLLDLLSSTPEPLLGDLVQTLSRYDDAVTTDSLRKLSGDARATFTARGAAIAALSVRRTPDTAGWLIQLADPQQPMAVREAAAAGLSRLTGITDLGSDPVKWKQWYNKNKSLPAQAWADRLFENFEQSRELLAGKANQLEGRLVETQRQYYRANAAANRPALLVEMFKDPLEAIRLLAMDLTVQMVGESGPAGVPANVRAALVGRLDDAAPTIRQRSALLLRDLGDEAGAEKVAKVISLGGEERPELLHAYLLLLARSPKASAVNQALNLLEDASLGRDAAGFLAAAIDADLLSPQQKSRALAIVRAQARGGQPSDPDMVTLLGRIGQESDWKKMEAWLDSQDAQVRDAAARAWGRSKRPLQPLAARSRDPVIRPILFDSAARRGDDPALFRAVADARPSGDQPLEPWERALIAMAGRIDPSVVMQVEPLLLKDKTLTDLCQKILGAAVDAMESSIEHSPLSDRQKQAVVELLARRAELHMSGDDPRAVLADVQRLGLFKAQPTPAQKLRLDMLTLRARLAVGDEEAALEIVRPMLAGQPSPDAATVFSTVLASAQREQKSGAFDRARQLTVGLRTTLGPAPDPSYSQPLLAMEKTLGIAPPVLPSTQPSATQPATQPATTAPVTQPSH